MVAATNCGDRPEISVLMQVSVRFDTNLERDAIDSIASNLAPLFEPGGDVPPHRIGLYLSSADAGVATSVRFWSEARRTGLGMANPELFPWCLANAPAAALARRFGITGPNYTLLGEGDALLAVFNTASDDLLTERIDAAVVIALEMKTGRCSGLRLARAAAAAPTVQTGDLTGHSGCAPGTCPPLLSAVGRGTLETTDAAQTLSSD
jgi:3-oxoacyl-(acyl-carrier-protein) synthase